jgi:hypothetical protein
MAWYVHLRSQLVHSTARTHPLGVVRRIPGRRYMQQLQFYKPAQLGHMIPPAPTDLMVFDQRETDGDAPVAIPSQVAKVLGEV